MKIKSTNINFLSVEEKAALITALESKKVWTLEELAIYSGYQESYNYKMTSPKLREQSPNPIPVHNPGGKKLFFDRKEIQTWLLTDRNDN